ncbi:MAG TPA: enoyl-CoA hydratase-related protein [Dehalococcoidia bacterium]|nr:enoyl-CoA hydratase-related protein [Dehalococcoidia bacterium]
MAILYEKKGRIAYVTINRPDALNAIDPETNDELSHAFHDFRDDPELWVAILTGAGDRAFCSGADLKALIPHLSNLARADKLTTFSLGGITRDFACWKPIIGAINGYALAGGLELALACDLRVAAETARFGQPEVRWGLIPGAGGTQRLPRALPLARALELILMGTQLTAQEALQLGLINRVAPRDQVLAAAEEMANTLLEMGPLAIRLAKQAAYQGLDRPLDQGLDLEMRLFRQALLSDDAQEGPKAFAEKRKPAYTGR